MITEEEEDEEEEEEIEEDEEEEGGGRRMTMRMIMKEGRQPAHTMENDEEGEEKDRKVGTFYS